MESVKGFGKERGENYREKMRKTLRTLGMASPKQPTSPPSVEREGL